MRRVHVAESRPSQPSDEIEKEGQDEQELRDILKKSDEKAKQLFEKRIATRKKEDSY